MPRGLRRVSVVAIMSSVLAATAVVALGGCGASNRLETGYRYSPLGATAVERRGFYADRYSPEALRSEQGGGDDGFQRGRGPLNR